MIPAKSHLSHILLPNNRLAPVCHQLPDLHKTKLGLYIHRV